MCLGWLFSIHWHSRNNCFVCDRKVFDQRTTSIAIKKFEKKNGVFIVLNAVMQSMQLCRRCFLDCTSAAMQAADTRNDSCRFVTTVWRATGETNDTLQCQPDWTIAKESIRFKKKVSFSQQPNTMLLRFMLAFPFNWFWKTSAKKKIE